MLGNTNSSQTEDNTLLRDIASALRSQVSVGAAVDVMGVVHGYLATMDIHELMRIMSLTDDGEEELLAAGTTTSQQLSIQNASTEQLETGGHVIDEKLS